MEVKKKRLTLDLDPPLQRRLKVVAASQGDKYASVLSDGHRQGAGQRRGPRLWKALGRDGAADGRTAPAGLRHPPLRTGRATFTASGSPSDGLDRCVGNIGFSAILVGFIHPASGVVRFVPLPSDCPPSPCGRLSRPRTTTRALPHVRRWPKAGLLRCRRAGRASQVRPGCIFMPS